MIFLTLIFNVGFWLNLTLNFFIQNKTIHFIHSFEFLTDKLAKSVLETRQRDETNPFNAQTDSLHQ